jgi:predicted nucleic acid-binding protein
MEILIDSGILLRDFDRSSQDQKSILRALRISRQRNFILVSSHQNIAEFWNVATRPTDARGGFGLSPVEADRRVSTIEKIGRLLTFNHRCYEQWREIVNRYGVTGVSVHDARLVALTEFYAIAHILTLNPSDFKRYSTITAWTPTDVQATK